MGIIVLQCTRRHILYEILCHTPFFDWFLFLSMCAAVVFVGIFSVVHFLYLDRLIWCWIGKKNNESKNCTEKWCVRKQQQTTICYIVKCSSNTEKQAWNFVEMNTDWFFFILNKIEKGTQHSTLQYINVYKHVQ